MRKPKGIALFLVLTITGVIATMLGAFMTVNHSNFSLLASSMEQAEATQACLSGYNYALYRLEHDKLFGKEAFNGIDDAAPPTGTRLDDDLSCTLVEPSRLVFKIEGTRMSFEITIVNNLPLTSRVGGSPDPDTRPGNMPLIADDALWLRVVGRAGRATRRAEAVLHCAPAFDSSAQSNGDLVITEGQVTVDSHDKMRNFVKSNGDIRFPRIANNVRFQHTGDTSPTKNPPFGYAMARDSIFSGNTNLGQNNEALAQANADAQAFLAPKSPRKAEILNLDFQDIKLPDGEEANLPSGNYVFTTTKVNIPVRVEWTDSMGNEHAEQKNLRVTVPAIARRDFETGQTKHVWWSRSDIHIPEDTGLWLPGYGGARVTQLSGEFLAESVPNSQANAEGTVQLGEGVFANVWNANVAVAPGYKVNVEGDFGVLYERRNVRGTVSEGPDGIDLPTWRDTATENPDFKDAQLVLGDNGRGASLKATGKVDVRAVAGRGALMAHGDLALNGTLQAEGEGVTGGGLALLSDNNVIVKQPDTRVTRIDDAHANRLRDTKFTGLVYAENDFIVGQLLNSDGSTVGRNLEITGAVVARKGSIRVESTNNVKLTYDPKYLDDIVKDLSHNRIRLERYSFTFK